MCKNGVGVAVVERLEKLGICWERKCNANICWDPGLLDLYGVSLDSPLTAAAGTILCDHVRVEHEIE